ncbi:hypothetical protein D3C85_1430880 [compost metagenome]
MICEDLFQGEVQLMLVQDTLPHGFQSNTHVAMMLLFVRIGSKVSEGGTLDIEIYGFTIDEHTVHIKYDSIY